MSGLSSNKKILISVLAFVLVIAAIVGVLLILGGNSEETPGEHNAGRNPGINISIDDSSDTGGQSGGSVSGGQNGSSVSGGEQNGSDSGEQPGGSVSDGQSGGQSGGSVSNPLPTTSPAMATGNVGSAAQSAIIEAYISGNYYMSAVIDADGDRMNMDIALRGNDFQTSVNLDGKPITIIYMNGGIYLVDEAGKKYIEFSRSLLEMSGIDLSELSEVTDEIDLSNYKFTDVSVTQTQLGGRSADCHTYYTADTSIYFYFIGSELKRIDYGDTEGNIGITIDVNQFSATYPANMFNLSGLTKTTMFDFFGTTFE